MKKFRNVILLALCGIVFMIFACGSTSETSSETSSKTSSETNSETTSEEKFSYTIDKSYADEYGFAYYIEGVVTNKTDKDYSYVEIEFICYDSAGNNLGTALDNTTNLLGNQTWKYKAMFTGSDAETVDHCDYHETTSW